MAFYDVNIKQKTDDWGNDVTVQNKIMKYFVSPKIALHGYFIWEREREVALYK